MLTQAIKKQTSLNLTLPHTFSTLCVKNMLNDMSAIHPSQPELDTVSSQGLEARIDFTTPLLCKKAW